MWANANYKIQSDYSNWYEDRQNRLEWMSNFGGNAAAHETVDAWKAAGFNAYVDLSSGQAYVSYYNVSEDTQMGSDGVQYYDYWYEATPLAAEQQQLQDITEKFNNQLRKTEQYFTMWGNIYDDADFPSTGNPLSSIIQRRGAKLAFFGDKVGTNKEYDIKQRGKGFPPSEIGGLTAIYNGFVYNFDDFGNINYGVAARALGLTYVEAIAGAGYNQSIQTGTPDWDNPGGFLDHSRDTEMIKFGFYMTGPKK